VGDTPYYRYYSPALHSTFLLATTRATNGDRFWAKALHSRLKSHIERGPLRFFKISAFLSILAWARRAQNGRDEHTDGREIHALRSSKREKGR